MVSAVAVVVHLSRLRTGMRCTLSQALSRRLPSMVRTSGGSLDSDQDEWRHLVYKGAKRMFYEACSHCKREILTRGNVLKIFFLFLEDFGCL